MNILSSSSVVSGFICQKIVNKMSRTQAMGEYLQEFPPCPWWSLMVIKAVSLSLWRSVKIINEGLYLGCGNSGASFGGEDELKETNYLLGPCAAIQSVVSRAMFIIDTVMCTQEFCHM